MADYDFKALSSYDFELLVRDLLQEEIGKTLESFKTGRDKGIDLRYSPDRAKTLIVQCKHFASSNYTALYAHLKKELPKVELLKPQRYLVATSLGLTPANKTSMCELFKPYCLTPSDIYGRDDLNNLLGKFPQVEKNNFKLWLTSTTVLQRILQSAVFNQSDVEIENIRRKLRLYVGNESFQEASGILEQMHYCIIAGIPGIGKTTLAEMLIVDYLARGYEIIKVTANISEAYAAYRQTAKQLFYYDDFLGRIGLEDKLLKNEDQSILKFLETVHHSKENRLILTTREYILNQAKQTYESLAISNFDHNKCVISLAKYTEFQKAKILFNHVYFSEISTDYKANLLENKNYLKIIKHHNYNPRIIEVMTGFVAEPEQADATYTDTFLRNLDNPTKIWDHAFSKHISDASRHLLIVLITMPDAAHFDDLLIAFDAYYTYSAKWYGVPRQPDAFLNSLRELDGNFITFVVHDSERYITAHNPSILDFLHQRIASQPLVIEHLLASSVFFDQITRVWGGQSRKSAPVQAIQRVARQYSIEFLNALKRTFRSPRLRQRHFAFLSPASSPLERRVLFTIHLAEEQQTSEAYETVSYVLAELLAHIQKNDSDKDGLFELAQKLIGLPFDLGIETPLFLNAVKECFLRDMKQLDDFARILNFNETFGGITEQDMSHVELVLKVFLEKYLESDANLLQLSSEVEEYAENLELVADTFDYDVAKELDWLEGLAGELKAKEDEEERREYMADRAREEYGPVAASPSSGENIDSMFQTLISS